MFVPTQNLRSLGTGDSGLQSEPTQDLRTSTQNLRSLSVTR